MELQRLREDITEPSSGKVASNKGDPVTWTETDTSATPEPGTISLGLAGAVLTTCYCARKARIDRQRCAQRAI